MGMIPVVRIKDGVQIKLSPGGVRMLAAFDHAANEITHDLTITSGTDGAHSGPDDPHHRGDAYDVRIHDLPDPQLALKVIQDFLGDVHFFAWIEDAGQDNEHIHAQVRKGTVYPPAISSAPSSAPLSNHDDVADAAAGQ